MKILFMLFSLFLMNQTTHAFGLETEIGYLNFNAGPDKHHFQPTEELTLSGLCYSAIILDPSGSLLSFLGAASHNAGARLGAEQRAEKRSKELGGGPVTDSFEVQTSVRSSGDLQTLRIDWMPSGSLGWKDSVLKSGSSDNAEVSVLQAILSSNFAAWNDIFGKPISVLAYYRMVFGYASYNKDVRGYLLAKDDYYVTFPFGASVVWEGPKAISFEGHAGYDPITGIFAYFNKNVKNAWEAGASAEWQWRPWLITTAGYELQITNYESGLRKASIQSLHAGLRIDFSAL
jgi:hypothetical protein